MCNICNIIYYINLRRRKKYCLQPIELLFSLFCSDEFVTPSSEMTTAPPGVPGLQTPTGATGGPGHYNYTSGRPGLHTKSPQDGSPGVAPPTHITTAPPAVGPTGEPGVHILSPTPYFNTTGVCLSV